MKSVAILGCLLPLVLALPAVGQETETPKQEGHHPHVRIERKIVKIDSLGNRTETEDNSDQDVMIFHNDGNLDLPPDIGENFDIDVEISGDPSSPEFKEKMEAFQERMKAFGERMKEFGEKMKEEHGGMSVEMKEEIEQMRQDGAQMRQDGAQMRQDGAQMRQEMRMLRTLPSDPSSDSTIMLLQSGVANAEARVVELRARLKNLPKENPQYGTLKKDLADATKDLDEARVAVAEARNTGFFMSVDGSGGSMVYNINGMRINVDSIVSSATSTNGATLGFGSSMGNGRSRSVMVHVDTDSLHGAANMSITTNGDSKQAHRILVNFGCNDSLGNGIGPRIMIRSIASANGANAPGIDFTQGPVTMKSNTFYIDGDSVQMVDGKSAQMVVRIDRGGSDDGNVKVMVMSLERGRSSNEARPRTEGATPLADAPLIPRGSIGYQLGENVPNPFAEKTAISFTLPKPSHVTLSVFDGTGSLVKTLKDEEMSEGTHSVNFNASGLPSGIYLYRLVADGFSEAKTMTIAK